MKQLLSITTLFLAMMLLQSGATSESANNASTSPKAAQPPVKAARIQPPSIEIALVANAQDGTVALVDVASRSVLGAIDVNPAGAKSEGPGARITRRTPTSLPTGGRSTSRAAISATSRRSTSRPEAVVAAAVQHRARRPHDADAGRTEPLRVGAPGQSGLSDRGRHGRDHWLFGHWRLSARQQGLEGWPSTLQHQHRPARFASPRPRSAAHGDAGRSIPADHRRRRHAGDPRPHTVRQRHSSLAVHPGRKGLYAQLSNEHAVVAYDLATKIVKRLDLPVKPGYHGR